jgi:phosphoribosyl 1,2-cyclic phosphodiesterase
MTFRFASLGSGSSGNATLVSDGDTHILIDCGFSIKETQRRIERLGLCLSSIAAVLVTHEHSDHLKGVPALARKYAMPVYMTPGTYHSRDLGPLPDVRLIHNYEAFGVGQLHVQPVAVPHDAKEPAQFILRKGKVALGILTDLGSVTTHVLEAYDGCQALLLEANHDRQMLAQGPYPPSLKTRVAGPWGHLSNEQTVALLEQMDTSQLRHLVVGHISRKNNSVELAQRALAKVSKSLGAIYYACQDEGFDWIELV